MGPAAHRRFCHAVAIAAAAWGGALLFWPALSSRLPTGPLPTLHARCIGAMYLALAFGLGSARRRVDAAAARLPLLLVATWGAVAMFAALVAAPPLSGLVWLGCMSVVAVAAAWLGTRAEGVAAPAEHWGRGWVVVALPAGLLALGLLLLPDRAAAQWPWPMRPAQAAAYGAPLLGFAAMAWASARERRRYVREPALHAWLALAVGLLAASLLHHELFDRARAVTWIWFGAFAAVATWAARGVSSSHRRP